MKTVKNFIVIAGLVVTATFLFALASAFDTPSQTQAMGIMNPMSPASPANPANALNPRSIKAQMIIPSLRTSDIETKALALTKQAFGC